ncbi:MAG: hypothetical protein ACFBZ8_13710 [Opitutales bacterium]
MRDGLMIHLVWAVSGLLLVGGGLSVFGHAVILKMEAPEAFARWVAWGTGSLVLVNAGLCLVVEAAVRKSRRAVAE